MKTKPAKKKWTRTEWLLLLAPLVVIVGLGAMNFAPQLQREWREWRQYGSNRPYAVFWVENEGSAKQVLFFPVAFSPNGRLLCAAEDEPIKGNGQLKRNYFAHVWDIGSFCKVSSWKLEAFGGGKRWRSFVRNLWFDSNQVVSQRMDWPPSIQKRETQTGRLISARFSPSVAPEYSIASKYQENLKADGWALSRFNAAQQLSVRIQVTSVSDKPVVSPRMDDRLALLDYKAYLFSQGTKRRSSFSLLRHYAVYTDYRSKIIKSAPQTTFTFTTSPDARTLLLHIEVPHIPRNLEGVRIQQMSGSFLKAYDTQSGKLLWEKSTGGELLTQTMLQATTFGNGKLALLSNVRKLVKVSSYELKTKAEVGLIEVLNLRTGMILNTFEIPQPAYWSVRPGGMRLSPDGKLLAVPQKDRLELWDVSDLN